MSKTRSRLLHEEDYRTGFNLTPEQAEHNEAWLALKDVQTGRVDAKFKVLGYKAAVLDGACLEPISKDSLIRHWQSVVCFGMSRIPTEHWRLATSNRRFRWNFQEHPFEIDESDHTLAALGGDDKDLQTSYLIQADALLSPPQERYMFDLIDYDPYRDDPGDPVLVAPRAGLFRVERNAQHINLLVGGHLAFRFDVDDIAALELSPASDELAPNDTQVQAGVPLARVVDKVTYGVAALRRDGLPIRKKVRGDFLSASRDKINFRLMNRMLNRLVGAVRGMDEPRSLSDWAPKVLLEFSPGTLRCLTTQDGWTLTPDMKERIKYELGPNGQLYMTAPFDGFQGFSPDKRFALFEGDRRVAVNPECILESVLNGLAPVEKGDPIANWLPRGVYYDWPTIESSLAPVLHSIAEQVLMSEIILPGWEGYSGTEMLVPYELVGGVAFLADDYYLDFRNAVNMLDEEGLVVGPATSHPDWTDMYFDVNHVKYSLYPYGSEFITEVTDSRSGETRARVRV